MLPVPKAPAQKRQEDRFEGLDEATRAKLKILEEWSDQEDEEISLGERAGAKTIICHLANVNQENYEEWRDSMPDEYYFALIEDLSTEARQKVLMRFI